MIGSSEPNPHRRYRLIAEIGRGGMAEVYLAVSQSPGGFNKLVVIKKTLQNLALRPEILSMFMDEARLAARMNHPNVVQTYELGEEDGRQFIAMEFLDGQPYSRILARLRGRTGGLEGMSLAHHLRILVDTLAGLHHAHELRDFDGTPLHVVHRDVTPHNVFITYDGSIKVVDFGIAKAQDSSSNTVTGEIKGKISYMSPEQVRGEPVDRRSDVFAVGVLLWEAVAGHRMWKDLPDVTVLHELMNGSIPSIREAAPDVPDDVARVIERALALDREQRYPSALAMQRDLDELAYARGLRVDGPEVGRVVSELFDEERRRVRSVIEAQLGSLRWTGEHPASSNLPVIAAGRGSISGDGTGRTLGPEPAKIGGSYPTVPTHSGAALSMRAPQPSPRRWAVLLLAGVTVGVTAAGVVAVALWGPSRPVAPAGASATGTDGVSAAPPPSSVATTDTTVAAAPDAVTLRVRVEPPEAKILLDGVLLGGGSYEGKVRRGDDERVLRVEAAGHEPKEEKVRLTSDVMMSISLEKLAGAPPSGPLPGSLRPPSTRPTAPPSRPGGGIDSESPYK